MQSEGQMSKTHQCLCLYNSGKMDTVWLDNQATLANRAATNGLLKVKISLYY